MQRQFITIRSGGQTGADRGALDAAREANVSIRGWCPKDGWAEDVTEPPGILANYPELVEAPSADPIVRTEWNVRDSDATLIVCPGEMARPSGTYATLQFAQRYGKPYLISTGIDFKNVVSWLQELEHSFPNGFDLNVAGPRESGSPGIYALTRSLIAQALKHLAATDTSSMTMLDDLIACEFARFSINDYRGLPTAPEFEIVSGELPVIISAPHAVTCIRNGKVKPSEDYIGAIALAVAERSGCHAIAATRTGEGDPNWDALEESPYKQALCDHVRENGIRFAIDLHGMVAASPALVAVGSADGETVAQTPGLDVRITDFLLDALGEYSKRYDKPIVLNGQYAARGENTVVRTVARECSIPALQIEVATQLRVPARREGHTPEGEAVPFSGKQLPVEIAARKVADPVAVDSFIGALCKAIRLALD